jgi:hypothetical protein
MPELIPTSYQRHEFTAATASERHVKMSMQSCCRHRSNSMECGHAGPLMERLVSLGAGTPGTTADKRL